MLLAHIEEDPDTLARLVTQAELWENPYLVERGKSLLAELLREPSLLEGLQGFLARLTRALLTQDPAHLPPYPAERRNGSTGTRPATASCGRRATLTPSLPLPTPRSGSSPASSPSTSSPAAFPSWPGPTP